MTGMHGFPILLNGPYELFEGSDEALDNTDGVFEDRQLQGSSAAVSSQADAQAVTESVGPIEVLAPANGFSAAAPFLDQASSSQSGRRAVAERCLDRSVLLVELIEQVGAQQVAQVLCCEARLVDELSAKIRGMRTFRAEAANRGRYVPSGTAEALADLRATFDDRVVRSRPPAWSLAELASIGVPVSSACLIGIAKDIFEEVSVVASSHHGRASFAWRCSKSGCPFLVPLYHSARHGQQLSAEAAGPPMKRLRQARETLGSSQDWCDPAWRFRGHLELELQLRVSMQSISKSWKSYCSGWSAWHYFMVTYHQFELHFPITLERAAAFGSHFRN